MKRVIFILILLPSCSFFAKVDECPVCTEEQQEAIRKTIEIYRHRF